MMSAQGTPRRAALGVPLAVASALAFGLGGAFASPLLAAGWTPGGVALVRVSLAALVLAGPAALAMRGRWVVLWRARRRILAYAVLAVAGTQLAFYASIERIPVGTALLVQYLAPVLLIVVVWARSRRAPARVVLAGSGLAVAGLALVIGPSGLGGSLDLVGVGFSALAMIGVAVYFVLSAVPGDEVPPVALAGSGFALGALVIGLAGALGALPIRVRLVEVELGGAQVPWILPLALLVLVSTAFSYVCGITTAGLLGSRAASFFGLLEVVFATLAAWLLLGQAIEQVQILGTVLVVAGVVVVKLERVQPVVIATMPIPVVAVDGGLATVSSSSLVDDESAVEVPVTLAVPLATAPIDLMSFPTALPTPVPAESLAEPESVAMPMTVPIEIMVPVDVIADAAVEEAAALEGTHEERAHEERAHEERTHEGGADRMRTA